MSKLVELPDKWYIEITDENRPIINPWKIKQRFNDDLFDNLDYKYVTNDGGGGLAYPPAVALITTSQFEELILKTLQPITNENNERLKYLLKQII